MTYELVYKLLCCKYFVLQCITCTYFFASNSSSFWWGNLKETQRVDGRIILRWIVRKWDVGVWTGSSWLRIGTGGGHL
jgi:hypothetical protein